MMSSFLIKVPNNDEGEDLGEYQSDYLPRVGDSFAVWHRRLSPKKDTPFLGVVSAVAHEVFDKDHPYGDLASKNRVVTTVWLIEEAAAPTIYCDCTEQERTLHGATDGECENCGHVRSES
jgi:hypothetical protein